MAHTSNRARECKKALDLPYKIFGQKHKKCFHEPTEAHIMGATSPLDYTGGTAALLHIWLDEKCSETKNLKNESNSLKDKTSIKDGEDTSTKNKSNYGTN